MQDMEHQHANLCSRLGTAAGISHGSPLPGGKKKKQKNAVSPAVKKSFRFSVENVVVLFTF